MSGYGNRLYIGGTFDCLHRGHINLLRRASEFGRVVVSLNTDEFAARYKRRPLVPLEDRMAVIKELRCVDEVIVNEGDEDSKPAILRARPTHIVHGDDWVGEDLMKQMGLSSEWLEEQGIDFLYLPYTPEVSTTKLRMAASSLPF